MSNGLNYIIALLENHAYLLQRHINEINFDLMNSELDYMKERNQKELDSKLADLKLLKEGIKDFIKIVEQNAVQENKI